jgi:protein-S-isoprenylcysteine O-methyltransferase Ste14
MGTYINIGACLLFGSEFLIFLLKRSKSSETKVKRDKLSAPIFWIVIPASIFFGAHTSEYCQIIGNYRPIFIGAIITIIIGLIIRWTAILQLKKAFTIDVAIAHDHKIKKDGLYKIIRHPSYLGLILEFFGFSLMFNSWSSAFIITMPLLFALIYRMKIEEELLVNTFGSDYQEYMKKTKRLLPGIY